MFRFVKTVDSESVLKLDQFQPSSVLDDGTFVKRIYTSDILETKRVSSLNKLGSKWVFHPSNNIKRLLCHA